MRRERRREGEGERERERERENERIGGVKGRMGEHERERERERVCKSKGKCKKLSSKVEDFSSGLSVSIHASWIRGRKHFFRKDKKICHTHVGTQIHTYYLSIFLL
jgi:hypothetical protein